MIDLKKSWAMPAALILGVALLGGCAANKEAIEDAQTTALDAKDEAAAAQSSADNASQAAARAQQTADAANRKASEAAQQASQALDMADSNRSAIDEINEKLDRMFKKAMRK